MLVDTSVWIDHLRRGSAALSERLRRGEVWSHPFIIGELACGNLRRRREILSWLEALPQSPVADHGEVLIFVESNRLMGLGIGWIDVHLLASTRMAHTLIWTTDRRLAVEARRLGLLFEA